MTTMASVADDDGEDGGPSGSEGDAADFDAARAQLNKTMMSKGMTGQELKDAIFDRWGRCYEARLQRRGKKIYL
jgi:hypothetical protein